MNYMTKDLPKNSQVFFRYLIIVSIVRITMVEKTYRNNKIKCYIFVLVDILSVEL